MDRRSRQDHPGSWHNVINRGLAKRPPEENSTYAQTAAEIDTAAVVACHPIFERTEKIG